MLSTILFIDAVLFCAIGLWLGVIHIVGNNDQRGGVGFVAFFLSIAIVIISVVILLVGFLFNAIWN